MSSATIPVVPPPGPVPGGVFVYLIEGQDGALYAGSAKDVRHRLCQHESGRGSKFTRDHGVGSLVFVEGPLDPVAAIRRERQLKGWSRAKKLALIGGDLDELRSLARRRG